MKVLCLGGAGKICREATLDLVQFSDFKGITSRSTPFNLLVSGLPASVGGKAITTETHYD